MSKKNNNVEIHLESLNGMAPFILAADDDLVITWASPAVLQRFGGAVGLEAAELLEFDDPKEKITADSVQANCGMYRRFALLDGFPSTPLAGRWIETTKSETPREQPGKKGRKKRGAASKAEQAKGGYVFLATPHVSGKRDLELRLFTFKDFPQDGSLVDYLIMKDKFTNTLSAMNRALRTLKNRSHRVEISGMRSDRNVVRLQREMGAPRHSDRSDQSGENVDASQTRPTGVGQGFPIQGTAVYTVDVEGRITGINEAFHKMTGYSEVEVLGRNSTLLHEEPFEFFVPENGDTLDGDQCRLRTKNGRRLLVLKGSSKVRDHLGHVTGSVESFVDVTALGAAINTAREEGVSASAFVINRNLEAEGAMRGIVEMLGLVLHSDLRPEQCEQIGLIRSYSDVLLDRLSDVADSIRLRSDSIELDVQDFSLRSLVGQAAEIPSQQAREKGVSLECNVETSVPDALKGDRGRLRRVMGNIMGNAVRFTERGRIVVTVEVESRTEEKVLLRFIVSDTGQGMSEERKRSIMDSLESENPFCDAGEKGIGLGLLISSQLVRLMGGGLWFESEAGRGSSFHFNAYFAPGRLDIVDHRRSPGVDERRTPGEANAQALREAPVVPAPQPVFTEPGTTRRDPLAPTSKPVRAEDHTTPGAPGPQRTVEQIPPQPRAEDALQSATGVQVLTRPAEEQASVQTVVEPEQPQVAVEPQTAPEPQTTTEPQVTVEPQRATESQTTVEPQTSTEAKVTVEPQTVPEPRVTAEPQTAAEPKVTTEPQTTAEPKVTVEPQTATEPQTTVEPQTSTEAQVTVEPQTAPEPQHTAEPQATVEPRAAAEPEEAVARQSKLEGEEPKTARVQAEQAAVTQELAQKVGVDKVQPQPDVELVEEKAESKPAEQKTTHAAQPKLETVEEIKDEEPAQKENDDELESFVARFDPLSPSSKTGRIKQRLANAAAAEEAAKRAEEERARIKAAEEEASRAIGAELARRQAAERAEIEASEKAAAEEAAAKAAEEAQKRAAEEAEKKAAEAAVAKATEDAKRKAAEEAQKRAAEEAEKKAVEEAAAKAAEEAKLKAAQEAKRKAAEEAAAKAAEDAKLKAAEEAKRKAAEDAKRKAAEEAAAKAAENEKRKAAEQAAVEAAKKRGAEERAAKEAAAKAAKTAKKKAEEQKAEKSSETQKTKKTAGGGEIEEVVSQAAEDALKKAMTDDSAKESGRGAESSAKKEKMTTKTITVPVSASDDPPSADGSSPADGSQQKAAEKKDRTPEKPEQERKETRSGQKAESEMEAPEEAPRGETATEGEEIDPDDPLLNLPVLVVDDNRKNRRELKAMLRGWNMKPTVVNGGRAALAALRQSMQAGKPYGLMLLDAEMPEMDGFQIAEKIKESDLDVGEIIMLTSDDQLIDSARLKELGIAACLWMPVKPKVLLTKITQVIEAEFDKTDSPPDGEK